MGGQEHKQPSDLLTEPMQPFQRRAAVLFALVVFAMVIGASLQSRASLPLSPTLLAISLNAELLLYALGCFLLLLQLRLLRSRELVLLIAAYSWSACCAALGLAAAVRGLAPDGLLAATPAAAWLSLLAYSGFAVALGLACWQRKPVAAAVLSAAQIPRASVLAVLLPALAALTCAVLLLAARPALAPWQALLAGPGQGRFAWPYAVVIAVASCAWLACCLRGRLRQRLDLWLFCVLTTLLGSVLLAGLAAGDPASAAASAAAYWERAFAVLSAALLPGLLLGSLQGLYANSLLQRQADTEAALRRVQASEQRLRAVLEAIPDPVVLSIEGETPVETNRAFREQLGPAGLEQMAAGVELGNEFTVETGGAQRVYELARSALHDSEGLQCGVVSVAREVTARQRSELALRQSEASLARAQLVAGIGSWTCEVATGATHWTPEAYRIFGKPLGSTVGRDTFLDTAAPEERPQLLAAWRSAMQQGAPYVAERPLIVAGGMRWIRERIEFELDARGKPARAIGIVQDVTEQKTAELGMAASERRFRRAIERSPVPTLIFQGQDELVSVNRAWLELSGYRASDLRELAAWSAQALPELNLPGAPLFRIVGAREHCLVRRDGSLAYWVLSAASLGRGSDGVEQQIVTALDVTERVRGEQALRQSQELFKRAQEMAHVGYWQVNLLEASVLTSDEAGAIIGLARTHARLGELVRRVHPADRAMRRRAWRSVMMGLDMLDIEFRLIVAGELRWVHVKGEFERNEHGQVVSASGMLRDITGQREAEIRLEAARDRTRLYLNVAEVVMVVIDHAGRIEMINRKGCEILGLAEADAVGQDWFTFCSDQQRETLRARYLASVEGRGPESGVIEYPLIDLRGREHLIEWRAVMVRGAGSSFVSCVGSGREVTAERHAQRELENHQQRLEDEVLVRTSELRRQKLALEELVSKRAEANQALLERETFIRAIYDAVDDAILLLDTFTDQIVESNIAAGRLFGRPRSQLIGMRVSLLLQVDASGEDWEEFQKGLERAVMHGTGVFERYNVGPGGEGRWLELHVSPCEQGGESRLLMAVRDISARKASEAAAAASLEEARRLAQARSDFLANMSHEIRTPLNAILGLAALGRKQEHSPTALRHFARIADSGEMLLAVVNDVLDFSKIEAGKFEVERLPFVLGRTLDRAMDLIAPRAYAKGLNLRLVEDRQLPRACMGDPVRLTQVLVNLLGNAVKFTAQGEVVLEVGLRNGLSGGKELVFRVRDTGIGMSEEQLARLFKPFEQADSSTTRRFGGTGLGLTICKSLSELMGGSLSVRSRLGKGSSFELCLPLEACADEEEAPCASAEALPASLVLCGLEAEEARQARLELASLGVSALELGAAEALSGAKDAFMVCTLAALAQPNLAATALEAARAGRRLGILLTPGEDDSTLAPLRPHVQLIERPLRIRQLLAAARGSAPAMPVGGAERRLRGLRVLAAEDIEVNRMVLEEMLQLEGASVVFGDNGALALALFEQHGAAAFDLLITDIQMPVMDGYALTRAVLAQAPQFPVIGLTAHAMGEQREACLASGMREHVVKPVNIDALVATICRVVKWAPQTPPPIALASPEAPAAACQTAVLRAADSIEWDTLVERFRGKTSFVQRLARSVLESQQAAAERIRAAALARDHAALAALAHTLKGAAGNLQAMRVYRLASELEQLARSAAPDEGVAQAAVDALCEALQQMLDALREFLAASASEAPAASAPQPIDPARLAALSDALVERRTEAHRIAEELLAQAAPWSAAQRAALEAALRFDFAGALQLLDESAREEVRK